MVLSRRTLAIWARGSTCECLRSLRAPTPRVLQSASQSKKILHKRTFTSSPKRRLQSSPEPDFEISKSPTHSASPPQSNQKEVLQTYIDAVQRIITGHQLSKKENMNPRQYQGLQTALAQAEARMNAPDAQPESFSQTLKALQAETQPTLNIRFGTENLDRIISKIGQESPPPDTSAFPFQRPRSVATLLNKTFESRPDAGSSENAKPQKLPGLQDYYSRITKNSRSGTSILDGIMSLEPRGNGQGSSSDPFGALRRRDEDFIKRQMEQDHGVAIRLSSSVSKTVDVQGATDLNRAFQKMEYLCARNEVKKELNKQKFHVRRGQLRKLTRISRWRRQFKAGFRAELQRVERMRRQGW
jgi:hypothetical protein